MDKDTEARLKADHQRMVLALQVIAEAHALNGYGATRSSANEATLTLLNLNFQEWPGK